MPCFSEADVTDADGCPGEQGAETADGEKPVEDLVMDTRVRDQG
jgi:hypothetical protein